MLKFEWVAKINSLVIKVATLAGWREMGYIVMGKCQSEHTFYGYSYFNPYLSKYAVWRVKSKAQNWATALYSLDFKKPALGNPQTT